jgi:8-oxo-dGTP pyrophosphatase MutT (NUDIX family)
VSKDPGGADGQPPAAPPDHAFGATFLAQVRVHLGTFERRAVALDGRRAAAVAVVIAPDPDGRACFLLTRRAAGLRAHARQWALPGGAIDRGESAERAALRELEEELGLKIGAEAILGCLDDYGTRSGFVITPVVVWGDGLGEPVPNPVEVAAVYRVPLADLDDPAVPRFLTIPESDRPVIQVPILGAFIHAPTAAVLYQLREVVVHGRSTRVDHFEQPVWAWR